MSYVDRNLTAGETVIYKTRLHWIVMLHHIIMALIAAAGAGVLLYFAFSQDSLSQESAHTFQIVACVLLVAAVATLIIGAVQRNSTEMAVTNRRVVIKVGLVGRRTVALLPHKGESIEVQDAAPGRMRGHAPAVGIGTAR